MSVKCCYLRGCADKQETNFIRLIRNLKRHEHSIGVPKMKIAVVGSGISGLTCAYYLSLKGEVHIFEANSVVGGHTNTITVKVPSGAYAIDTGFIVFNDRTYPNFIRLMKEIQVPSQPSSMSFSVKVAGSGLEYNGADLNRLFIQRKNLLRPSFYRMIMDILRFNREAPLLLDQLNSEHISLGSYLMSNDYSSEFRDNYIIPMGSAIWSSSVSQMMEFPAVTFIRFFKNHGMLSVNDRPQWRVIKNGSRSYLPGITKPFNDRIHVNARVQSVKRDEENVVLKIEDEGGLKEARFDHVVLAGHSDQSLAVLSDATPLEREVLGSFSYQENHTLLHTDTSVLPQRKRAWASWNYFVPEESRNKVAVTYDMNILQSLSSPETFLVSLNMEDRIDPRHILKKIVYHHPVYNARSINAQKQWGKVSGVNRTHFCGAYWGYGFHEDGVVSALRVCESFGVNP